MDGERPDLPEREYCERKFQPFFRRRGNSLFFEEEKGKDREKKRREGNRSIKKGFYP